MVETQETTTETHVVELARRATEPLNAAEGLTAVSELRRQLDSFEAGYVEEAFYEGWSWSRIAGCLGVSRQAAHHKYAKPLKAKRRRWRRLRDRVTFPLEMQRIVRRAMAEAQIMGHRRVDAGHLLLGIASGDEGPAVEALTVSGISLPRLREQATRLNSPELRPEHLLLALLRPPEGPIRKLLVRMGVLPDEIGDRLRSELSDQEAPTARAEATAGA